MQTIYDYWTSGFINYLYFQEWPFLLIPFNNFNGKIIHCTHLLRYCDLFLLWDDIGFHCRGHTWSCLIWGGIAPEKTSDLLNNDTCITLLINDILQAIDFYGVAPGERNQFHHIYND